MTKEDELRKAGVPVQPEVLQSQIWMEALRALGYSFRLNLCDDSVEINGNGTKLSDLIMRRIRTQMGDRGVKRTMLSAVEDAYHTEAERNAYHPVADFFNGLDGKWDGVDRLTQLALKIKSDSGIVEYADGRRTPLHAVYMGRWMIGVLAKALDGKQNPMLTLDGSQGLGKSLLARWLCPLGDDFFIEGPINPQDKDCDVRLMSKLIWEVSELDATTRKADVSALKSFLTKGQVTVRKSYGRHDITKPAICSFIGTINGTASGFLADETGNRRFLIVRITAIDWSYRDIDRYQLWAQVYHLYRNLEMQPELAPEEQAMQTAINERYQMESPIDDWLAKYFTITGEPDDFLTIGGIIEHLSDCGHRLHGSERAQAMEVARALVALGVQKQHTRLGKRWVGITINHAKA